MRYTYVRAGTGDTLSSIAAMHGITEDALRFANGLTPQATLRAGQMLKVPLRVGAAATPTPPSPPTRPVPKPSASPTIPSKPPPGPPPAGAAPGVISRGRTDRRVIGLTFETAFGVGVTPAVLAELRRAGVSATWFLSGIWAEKHPGLVRAILAAGHQVETHAYSHRHLRELDEAGMREEVLQGVRAVAAASGGRKPRFLRPPFGSHSQTLVSVAEKLGLRVVLWSFDSLDWQNPGPGYVADRIVRLAQPGAIIHMHASADQAPAALRLALPRLRAAGFEFVTLEELLRPGGAVK
jgi:peptidoglycan-N-acetylglucosamine deacetylase